ncbi:YcxB family protein [Pseudoalteromonas sp. T1lg65]|uniref:YcxB family protein n=1 Tax=Pseudoalteromonas sp. T1lg65 TaxID=2077101 RepID=UPI003F79D4CA
MNNKYNDDPQNTFQSQYILDKPYFIECYEESEQNGLGGKPKITLIAMLVLLGLVAIYLLQQSYLGNFLILLAVLECVAFYYRKPWWVARQMISRVAGNTITLTIDQQGITSDSLQKNFSYQFTELDKIQETQRGFLLFHKKNATYISKSILNEPAIALLQAQSANLEN